MDKTALKNFAMEAREKLIKDIEDKAILIGISEEGIQDPLPESTGDMKVFNIGEMETHRIYDEDVKKYEGLVRELERREEESDYETAYNTLVEEIAYTWFNRIIAIRFMEVNNYLPDRIRVLSSGREGVREPEIIANYRNTDIGIREEEFNWLDELRLDGSANAMKDIFQFLFIKQCNALNKYLPQLFEKTDDYAELLLNISYQDPQGVVRKLVEDIGEGPFNINETGQIEIIGWLYQYYNTVPKSEVDASKKKVDKNTLPAKTQLFTPEWIVKYMVENSLGRLWIERKIAMGSDKTEEELAEEYEWKYYLPEAEQVEEVEIQLKEIREDRKDLRLEDIRFIDPSMGSGHVLVYAFEVFMQFYLEEGYMEREAAESIIENNLYGLDIDKRAYQLAYFSTMMKGRQYSRRILNKNIENNLYYFIDSKDVNLKQIDYLGGNIEDEKEREDLKKEILDIVELFRNGRELGSIIKIEEEYDYEKLVEFVENINDKDVLPMELFGIENTQRDIRYILGLLNILSSKYYIAVTNPPYLGRRHMGPNLTKYLDKKYKDTKRDLFAVFMEKCDELLVQNGYYGMINQHSWMFLSSFKNYREKLLLGNNIVNMLHLGPRAFEEIGGEVVQSTAFINKKNKTEGYIGAYIRLVDFRSAEDKRKRVLEAINNPDCGYYYETNEDNFELIPGSPIAYWSSNRATRLFEENPLMINFSRPRQGVKTLNNNYFLKNWNEVSINKIGFEKKNLKDAANSNKKWFPYNKGGLYRKWYGNNSYVVNWENDGEEMKELALERYNSVTRTITNIKYFFREGLTWSSLTSGNISLRYFGRGYIFDSKGSSMFFNDKKYFNYVFGLINSKVSSYLLQILAPTLDFNIGSINNLPVKLDDYYLNDVIDLTNENVSISKTDWDSFETSWDFEIHPLLDPAKQDQVPNTIEEAYENWKGYANNNFRKLKENEERLNEIFIEIYGLEDELTPEVSDKDITIAKIFDDKKDLYDDIEGNRYILYKEDVVKSFISYGVGCLLGRYSLDEDGLSYAGGEFDMEKYKKIKPVEDNVLLITDKEYFNDDLVNRFIEFVEVAFGKDHLEENLEFIADSLKGRGTAREKIRNYFLNDFYKDHVGRYKKTPIYWMYDSSAGKTRRQSEDAFKALVYMHRYDKDTTGRVRMDYLHKVQGIYERRLKFLEDDIRNSEDAKTTSRLEEEVDRIIKQIQECKEYSEKLGHIALSRIDIDLDDGVKINYKKVQTNDKGEKYKILAKL